VNQESETSFKIILKQGYKRQIRQSCKVLGYEVVDLLRFRIVKLNLYELSLNEGEFKLIDNLYY
jgi:16S rRNA U516 pseudouridylate synthase RsuA-like enzyme